MARKPDPDEIIGYIDPRPARRGSAVGAIGVLGIILIYIAATHPPANLGWLLFLVVMGAGAMFLSWRMWTVTGVRMELTRREFREKDGRVLFEMDEVARVDRGFFAFKPAGGFLIKLKEPTSRGRVYAPGLWWRSGRTVMVGGVTSAAQAKSVADLITILLVERDKT